MTTSALVVAIKSLNLQTMTYFSGFLDIMMQVDEEAQGDSLQAATESETSDQGKRSF